MVYWGGKKTGSIYQRITAMLAGKSSVSIQMDKIKIAANINAFWIDPRKGSRLSQAVFQYRCTTVLVTFRMGGRSFDSGSFGKLTASSSETPRVSSGLRQRRNPSAGLTNGRTEPTLPSL
jgi:hypothetical protein